MQIVPRLLALAALGLLIPACASTKKADCCSSASAKCAAGDSKCSAPMAKKKAN